MPTKAKAKKDETTGPSYKLGQVNIDVLKEVLHKIADTLPFHEETAKTNFHAEIDNLSESGDPHTEDDTATPTVEEMQARIAELEAEKAA